MPTRLGDTPLHQKFWGELLKTSNSYALSQLWLVGIDISYLNSIKEQIILNMPHYEPNWEISSRLLDITIENRWFVGSKYYLLARGMQLPGDSIDVQRTGVNQSGNIKGLIGNQRSDLPIVTITFLETNQSFVDFFLRPLSILVGHKSLKEQNLKFPNIDLTCLQKAKMGSPLQIRKIIRLKNAVPINIDTEEYNYTGDKHLDRQVQFAYTKYIINTSLPSYTQIPGATSLQTRKGALSIQGNEGGAKIEATPLNINSRKVSQAAIDNGTSHSGDEVIPTLNIFSTNEVSQAAIDNGTSHLGDEILPSSTADESIQLQPNKNLLEQIEEGLDQAEGVFKTVQGKLNTVKDLSKRIVSTIPGKAGEQATSAIDEAFGDVQEVLEPAGEVIATGQQGARTARNIEQLGKEITSYGPSGAVNEPQRPASRK